MGEVKTAAAHVKARGGLVGGGSLLPCGSWRLNSESQAWQQVPLSIEISPGPTLFF